MIKFFRKIRRKLLAEGKTWSYLKYALGEIVLVVIGILIALQLNDWRDQRKNQASIALYTENLIEDLVKDSLSIHQTIEGVKEDTARLADFERRVFESESPLDTIVHIARYEFVYLVALNMELNNDTYEVLNSSGDIGLFNKEIIRDLNSLYTLREKADKIQELTGNNYASQFQNYARSYPVPFRSNLLKNGSRGADIMWEDISLKKHAASFNALVLTKGDFYRLSLRHLPQQAEKTNQLLAKLRTND